LDGSSIFWSGAKIFVHCSGGRAAVLAASAAALRPAAAAGGVKYRTERIRLAEKPREAAVTAMEIPTMA
jgi:hypothetical protein